MQTQVTQTNTTRAEATLSHADICRILGLAVAIDAGLRSDAPGTDISVDLAPAEADGQFTAAVSVLIDHNFVPPRPQDGQDGGAGSGTVDPSLNSAPGQPVVTPPPPPAPGAGVPVLGGLQIPGAPTA